MTPNEPDLSCLIKKLPPGLLVNPVVISFQPHLKAYRGKLLSGLHQPGKPVYAASFIRRREMILETQLIATPKKLNLILIHELFHFVWAHLGNPHRRGFAHLIQDELSANARGELGESALAAKPGNLKNYICESFCDTGAWLYSGVRNSPDFTLAQRWKLKRRTWFTKMLKRRTKID